MDRAEKQDQNNGSFMGIISWLFQQRKPEGPAIDAVLKGRIEDLEKTITLNHEDTWFRLMVNQCKDKGEGKGGL